MTNLIALNGGGKRRPGKRPARIAQQGAYQQAEDESLEMQMDGFWQTICSPIRLKGPARDPSSANWSYVVDIQNLDGVWSRLVMPAEWLLGDGSRALELIANRGGRIASGITSRLGVLRYISRSNDLDGNPLPRFVTASRTGWQGSSFVLPERVIGGTEDVIYQPRAHLRASIAERGTLADWQENVAGLAAGNRRLVLSISLAFAPPLMQPLQRTDGFIVHYRGGSSSGKTTALEVAGSVWGGGDIGGFSQSWHATSNGIEAMAEAHCDLPICLDELGQCRAEDASRVAYQLASGTGKGRALADGNGAKQKRWRTIGLSTGEISLEDKIRESKGAQRMMAGQAVRFNDLAADAEKGFGLFDSAPEIDGKPGATNRERGRAFADRLKAAVQLNYGTAGPAFVEALQSDLAGALIALDQLIEAILANLAPPVADGQVQRVARNFALIGAAGELATTLGIVPWPAGEASRAAEICFRDWLASRGTVGASEIDDAINHLRAIIERDGASRFQREQSPSEQIRDRIGYIKTDGITDETFYLFQSESWKSIMVGRDPSRTARELLDRGILKPGENNRLQRNERFPGLKKPQRFYVISHSALFTEADDDGCDE